MDWNRVLSGALATAWLVLCGIAAGVGGVLRGTLEIGLPLACIWFPEVLGSLTSVLSGPLSNMPITRASPGCAVRVLGWVALLVLTVLRVAIVGIMAP
jgi:hypothetical protein